MKLRNFYRDITMMGGGETYTQLDSLHRYFNNAEVKAIEAAIVHAQSLHDGVNQKYDGGSYFLKHVLNVYNFALENLHIIESSYRLPVLIATLFHDAIEDARVTYNDIQKTYGNAVAEIVFALTNDKGRTRKERAGKRYYKGIREIKYATYVKLCDRLANMSYSYEQGNKMFYVYKKEHEGFIGALKGTDTFFGRLKYWISDCIQSHEADYGSLYAELDQLAKKNIYKTKNGYTEI